MSWSVRDSLSTRLAMMHSGSAPSLCPADPRAARGSRRTEWELKGEDKVWRKAGVKVTLAAKSVEAAADGNGKTNSVSKGEIFISIYISKFHPA